MSRRRRPNPLRRRPLADLGEQVIHVRPRTGAVDPMTSAAGTASCSPLRRTMGPRRRVGQAVAALVVAVTVSWSPVSAAAEEPEVLSVRAEAGRNVSVVVELPRGADRGDARGATLVLPEVDAVRPASVSPVWSPSLTLAVVLAPPGRPARAAATRAAADLLLRVPDGTLMTLVTPADPPVVTAPLTADARTAVGTFGEKPPEGKPLAGAAIELAARQLTEAPRPGPRAVVVLSSSATLRSADVPRVARTLRKTEALLHVVHLSNGATPTWDGLVRAASGSSTRPGTEPTDAAAALRATYKLRFRLPPGPVPEAAQLRFAGDVSSPPLRLQLPGGATPVDQEPPRVEPPPADERFSPVLAVASGLAVVAGLLLAILAGRRAGRGTGPPAAVRPAGAASQSDSALPTLAVMAAGVGAGLLGLAASVSAGVPLAAPVLMAGLVALPVLLARPQLAVLALAVEDVTNLGGVGAQYGVTGIHTGLLAIAVAAVALAWARGALRVPRVPLVLVFAVLYLVAQLAAALAAGAPAESVVAVTETAKDIVLVGLVAVVVTATDAAVPLARVLVVTVTGLALLSVVQEFVFGNSTQFGGLSNVPLAADLGLFTARHSGPLLDPNFWGRVLVLVVPLALSLAAAAASRGVRVGWLAATAVLAAGVYLTGSRGSLLALVAAVATWLLLAGPRYRRVLVLSPLLLVLLAVPGVGTRLATLTDVGASSLSRPDPSLEGRRVAQAAGLLMVTEHPLMGVGPGRFVQEMPEYQRRYGLPESRPLAAHNLYLEQAAEGGVVVLLAWLGLFGSAVLVALRARALLHHWAGSGERASPQAALLADGVLAALAGWAVASLFLHLATFRTLLFVFAIAAGLEARARAAMSPGPSLASDTGALVRTTTSGPR